MHLKTSGIHGTVHDFEYVYQENESVTVQECRDNFLKYISEKSGGVYHESIKNQKVNCI